MALSLKAASATSAAITTPREQLASSFALKLSPLKGPAATRHWSEGWRRISIRRAQKLQREDHQKTARGPVAAVKDAAIDIIGEVKPNKFLVLGGAGFVGSAVCKAAVKEGLEVVSLSRRGRPYVAERWVQQVEWETGDVFTVNWPSLLEGVTTVMSCIGGFGSNEQMERVCGQANIVAAEAAKAAGVERFMFVSVHDYNFPPFLKDIGYFKGKQAAERSIQQLFPTRGVIFRPGFIYGERLVMAPGVGKIGIPLTPFGMVGQGVAGILTPLRGVLGKVPASDLLLAPPLAAETLGIAAAKAAQDASVFGILDIPAIKELANRQ